MVCLLKAARHGGSGDGATPLGAGGPGEERTHGGGGGQPAVCVGGLHGEQNKHTPNKHVFKPGCVCVWQGNPYSSHNNALLMSVNQLTELIFS